jgi:sulfide dehydrogenase cytochrome subunit
VNYKHVIHDYLRYRVCRSTLPDKRRSDLLRLQRRFHSEAFDEDISVKYSRAVIAVCASLAALALSSPVSAAQDQGARSLAANCTGCHGPSGNSSGAIPTIAGLERAYIVTAVQEFKAGTRHATVMQQHAKGYTDQEIEILADYFSEQKRP